MHVKSILLLFLLPLAGIVSGCGPESNPPVATAKPPADPYVRGVVTGPVGQQLTPDDRRTAGKAQYTAISEGKRKSWRGKAGTFGFIEPGAVGNGVGGKCREYSHTIYLNGRPQTAKGSACETQPGSWNVVS